MGRQEHSSHLTPSLIHSPDPSFLSSSLLELIPVLFADLDTSHMQALALLYFIPDDKGTNQERELAGSLKWSFSLDEVGSRVPSPLTSYPQTPQPW